MKQMDMAKISGMAFSLSDWWQTHMYTLFIHLKKSKQWLKHKQGGDYSPGSPRSARLRIRGDEFHRNFVVSENLPFQGCWQWLKCTKIFMVSITDGIDLKVNLEINERKRMEVGKTLPYGELQWKESNMISQLMSLPGSPCHCGKWW